MSRGAPELPHIDILEHGATRGGEEQTLDRRLFFQLMVVREYADEKVEENLKKAFQNERAVIYASVSDAKAFGILSWSEDPSYFVDVIRPKIRALEGADTAPEFSMLGRTYSGGYEQNLGHWLLEKPVDNVMNEDWNWAVWYPLRRKGEFQHLDAKEQGAILREHGTIGRAYGAQGLAHDVRLACHGLDTNDNDFVIGLIGPELYPLSHVVHTMRKTKQTSTFMEEMGPFFVGRAIARGTR